MPTVEHLAAADFDEVMCMMRTAFGGEKHPRFEELLPTIYQPTDRDMANLFAVRDKGAIVSATGAFPRTWCVGDAQLTLIGIGGVATLHEYRGKGLMSQTISAIVQMMRDEGVHASFLGGQRQRYRTFGWDKAGFQLEFKLLSKNFLHEPVGDVPVVTLMPLDPAEAKTLKRLHELYDAMPMHCVRESDRFEMYTRTWGNTPFVARDDTGKVVGSVILSRDGGTEIELVGADIMSRWAMLRAAYEQLNMAADAGGMVWLTLRHEFGPDAWTQLLGRAAEITCVQNSGNWFILDWQAVTNALMRVRHTLSPLSEGVVVLDIEGCPQRLRIFVSGSDAGSEWCSADADVQVDRFTANRLLFGPTPPWCVMPLPTEACQLNAWCPLPLVVPLQDQV